MARIMLGKYGIEIIATADDPDFLRLISNVSNICKLRRRDTYGCSLHLLPDVLFYLRGISTVDELPNGIAKEALAKELQRHSRTELLKQYGSDVEWPGLWGHQSLGVELASVNDRYNFFYDTRTGKTRMAYQIMLNALKAGKVKRCIVFTKSTIVKSWLSDAKEFPELKVAAFYEGDKQKEAALRQPSHIVIWSTGMAVSYMELIKKIKFDMCFFDESSALKNHRSEISKAAIELSTTIPYWYNLSATPAPNGEHEYYVQMRTVDQYCFNPARTHFISRYFDNLARDPKWEKLRMKENMHAEFRAIIEDHSIYVDQSVMPTAGKEWKTVPFELSSSCAAAYSKMKDKLALEASGTTITADTATAMRAKLLQITSGFILDSDAIKENRAIRKLRLDDDLQQEVYALEDNERIKVLQTLLQQLGNAQVVIWANYAAEFNSLRDLLGSSARYIRGGSSIKDKEDAIALFKMHKLQYLVCHPLSVGMGINLTEAHDAIYYSTTDSWEALKQSSERIYGHINVQPNKCTYWVLLGTIAGTQTVDGLVYDNVQNKREASTGFLEYLKAGYMHD